jgi:hypothetical protein
VLRAALADAVEEGLLHRSPAARVPMPRAVAEPAKQKEVDAWTEEQVARFLSVSADHRWAVAFRLGFLRRSEALALKWNDLDTKTRTLRIGAGWWVAARCSTSRPVGNATTSSATAGPPGARPERLVVSIMRRRCQRWGNHMTTEAFRRRREDVPSAAPGNSARSKRLTLQDARADTERRRSRRDAGDDGQALVRERVDTLGCRLGAGDGTASMPSSPSIRSRSGRPIVLPSSHAQWMACGAWRHSRGADPGHLGGSTAGTKMTGSAGAGTQNPTVAQPRNGIGANRATRHCLDC